MAETTLTDERKLGQFTYSGNTIDPSDVTIIRMVEEHSCGFYPGCVIFKFGDNVYVGDLEPDGEIYSAVDLTDVDLKEFSTSVNEHSRELGDVTHGSVVYRQIWADKALDNLDKWGEQRAAEILLAMQEELGELTQAWLQASYEGGDPEQFEEEIDDLGALLYQLVWELHGPGDSFKQVGEF